MQSPQKEQKYGLLILALTLLIFGTRFIGLTYNMQIHPDENKFYLSTVSLLESLLDPAAEFKEAKEYPEGAYLFQLPFQAAGYALAAITGTEQDPQTWGRISSVFYFTLAAVLGMLIQKQYLGKTRSSVVLYGLTMCFSLFYIEHARYGVGDMVSLFLMMLILYLTARAYSSEHTHRYLLLAFSAVGAMGAVKYPQVIFGLIPLSIFWYDRSRMSPKQWKRRLVLYGAVAFLTFLLFSPKAMFDWKYFYRVIRRESDAYLISGTAFEAGGILNHIAAMVLYNLLYSDFPLAFLLLAGCFAVGFWKNRDLLSLKEVPRETVLRFLFVYAVPGMGILFFLYNLLPSLLVFRTYTPFFGISALYASYAAAQMLEKKGWRRAVIWTLTAFLVIRGAGLMYVAASPEQTSREFAGKVYAATDENWTSTVCMDQYIIPFDQSGLVEPGFTNLTQWQEYNGGELELSPGTLVITGAYPFALADDYVLPIETKDADVIALWQRFLDVNQKYFVDRAYPDSFYYLFGGWIRGGTLSTSMIPCNYIFYCP